MEFLKDMLQYLMERKKWWLMPMLLVFLILGALLVLAPGSVVAPFIYSLF
jgi:competence protein ComGC